MKVSEFSTEEFYNKENCYLGKVTLSPLDLWRGDQFSRGTVKKDFSIVYTQKYSFSCTAIFNMCPDSWKWIWIRLVFYGNGKDYLGNLHQALELGINKNVCIVLGSDLSASDYISLSPWRVKSELLWRIIILPVVFIWTWVDGITANALSEVKLLFMEKGSVGIMKINADS